MALGAVLLEVFLANMPPPEESQLNLNKSQLGIQEDKKKPWESCGFCMGFVSPFLGICCFFLAFLRCKFKLVFDGGAAHFREFIGFCFAFLRFLILVQPIFWNLLGIVWESVGNPSDVLGSFLGVLLGFCGILFGFCEDNLGFGG